MSELTNLLSNPSLQGQLDDLRLGVTKSISITDDTGVVSHYVRYVWAKENGFRVIQALHGGAEGGGVILGSDQELKLFLAETIGRHSERRLILRERLRLTDLRKPVTFLSTL